MKRQPQTISIETPEHVELQFLLAGIGTRFLAYALDRLIQFLLILGLIFTGTIILAVLGVTDLLMSGLMSTVSIWIVGAGVLLYGLISLGYFILFEYFRNGVTPGKRVLSIRTIRADGRPLSLSDAAVRNILRFVDIFGDVFPVGLPVMFFDPRYRRLGDLAADTLVVVERPTGRPTVREQTTASREIDPAVQSIASHMLPEDHTLVAGFLSRREGLDAKRRENLARRICDRLYEKIDKRWVWPADPEAVLEDVELLYREKTRIL